jgi:ATP-dependent DNA ligase
MAPPLIREPFHRDGWVYEEQVDGWRRELTGRPLRYRRARLKNVVVGSDLVLPVRRLAKNGFEGLVAKDESSLYEAGPTRRWLKVKQKGWTDAEDRWQRRITTTAR